MNFILETFPLMMTPDTFSDNPPVPSEGKDVPIWALVVVSVATLFLLCLIGFVIHRVFKSQPVIVLIAEEPGVIETQIEKPEAEDGATPYENMETQERIKREAMVSMQEQPDGSEKL